jgi:hypothetical protein
MRILHQMLPAILKKIGIDKTIKLDETALRSTGLQRSNPTRRRTRQLNEGPFHPSLHIDTLGACAVSDLMFEIGPNQSYVTRAYSVSHW